VNIRTAQREQEIEGEKMQIIAECEIKVKTAQEARKDAEEMAKENTVKSMIQASTQQGMLENGAPMTPDQIQSHHN